MSVFSVFLSHNTPPGSKVKLLGRVPISHGFLLLNNSNCKVLGGRVEKLVESWELKRVCISICYKRSILKISSSCINCIRYENVSVLQ